MLGFGAKPATVSEPTVHGWREADLQFLAKQLGNERPLLQLRIKGFHQVLSVNGDSYSSAIRRNRADHAEYAKFALAFEGTPPDEDRLELVGTKNELVGFLAYPKVRAEGTFETGPDLEEIKAGKVGAVSITGKGGLGEPYSPLLEFHLYLQTRAQEAVLEETLRGTLGVSSHVFLNLLLHKVDDPPGWIEKLRNDGYTSSLEISAAHLISQVGTGQFD